MDDSTGVERVQATGVAREPRTILKYAVEVALPRAVRLLGMLVRTQAAAAAAARAGTRPFTV